MDRGASTTARASGRSARASRLSAPAATYSDDTDLFAAIVDELTRRKLDCVLVDEAQFLTRDHVLQLCRVADELGIPVLCYGLRTDFRGQLFPGSAALLALADALIELKAVCECGRKATMNLRVDAEGHAVAAGAQTEIGGNDRYIALCRRHFFERLNESEARQLAPRPAAPLILVVVFVDHEIGRVAVGQVFPHRGDVGRRRRPAASAPPRRPSPPARRCAAPGTPRPPRRRARTG